MAKNKISDLRDHLFAQLEALTDSDRPVEEEIERAKAVCAVAQQIIESAKVEVHLLDVLGANQPSAFFGQADRLLEAGEHEQVGRGFGNHGLGLRERRTQKPAKRAAAG
jgi:hypothetical protein